ncbi:MAG: anthranilate phosphoribosyltransferase [Deltaproteobacteria bacterium]|nr:anthranilate phosphoribosyltransferase [Deltaproteobacteria bacterium]
MMREILARVTNGENLDTESMAAAVSTIMDGEVSHTQMGAFLTALKVRGETEEEIAGAAMALRDRSVPFPGGDPGDALDTCGTGGDGAGTINVSTLVALTAAGAGARVAKHGNRSVSSRCGSADLLVALGVRTDVSPHVASRCLHETGFAFLFAPIYHPAMKAVAPVRKDLGFRTLFNLIGPLCNPAGVKRQLLGVFSVELVPLMAGVLSRLGTKRAMVVSSKDGLDEISVSSSTTVAEVIEGGGVRMRTLEPEDYGINRAKKGVLKGGTPEENAAISLEILQGGNGPVRDAVLLNTAAALEMAGVAGDMREGLDLAAHSIDRGLAIGVLERVRSITNDDFARNH